MPRPASRADRAAETRARIVTAGRALFARHGYEAASFRMLQEEVGLTRGGLFHHFDGKPALFRAVCGRVEGELIAWMRGAAEQAGDPWAGLQGACSALGLALGDAAVRRIILIDAPAVLAGERLDGERFELLRGLVEAAVVPGAPDGRRSKVDGLARFLQGGIEGCALAATGTDDEAASAVTLQTSILHVLNGLRATATTAPSDVPTAPIAGTTDAKPDREER